MIGSTSPKRSRPSPTCCSTPGSSHDDELRSDDAGVRAVQLLDEGADGVGVEGDVVVAEAEEPVVALDEAQHLVGGDAEAGVGAERAHEGVGQVVRDQRGEVVAVGVDGLAGEQEQRVQVGVVLAGERLERLLEPGSRVVDDDDRDDGRRDRGVGLHGARGYRRTSERPRHAPVT